MVKLPLKVKTDIRDKWDKEDTPVQTNLALVGKTLGMAATIKVDWEILWPALEATYPDKDSFVPSVATITNIFLECLASRIEDEDESWTDNFLEEIMQAHGLRIVLEVCQSSNPQASWNKHDYSISLKIPTHGRVSNLSTLRASLAKDLNNLFQQSVVPPVQESGTSEQDDGWSDVGSTHPAQPPAQPPAFRHPAPEERASRSEPPQSSVSSILPRADTLPRPEILFPNTLPYYLTVSRARGSIRVQGSHSASLELLAEYLKKWIRQMENVSRRLPVLKVELKTSLWGVETLFDAVHIELQDERQTWLDVNPTHILAFIDGVMGYKMFDTREGVWQFKRDTKFVR